MTQSKLHPRAIYREEEGKEGKEEEEEEEEEAGAVGRDERDGDPIHPADRSRGPSAGDPEEGGWNRHNSDK